MCFLFLCFIDKKIENLCINLFFVFLYKNIKSCIFILKLSYKLYFCYFGEFMRVVIIGGAVSGMIIVSRIRKLSKEIEVIVL